MKFLLLIALLYSFLLFFFFLIFLSQHCNFLRKRIALMKCKEILPCIIKHMMSMKKAMKTPR